MSVLKIQNKENTISLKWLQVLKQKMTPLHGKSSLKRRVKKFVENKLNYEIIIKYGSVSVNFSDIVLQSIDTSSININSQNISVTI